MLEQKMEDDMYEKLAGLDAAAIIKKFPNQSIDELATLLTEGMMMSWVGTVLGIYPKGYSVVCQNAFKGAVLRRLEEAKKKAV